jgi:hypothetical protein
LANVFQIVQFRARAAIRSAIADSTMDRIVGGNGPSPRRNWQNRLGPPRPTIKPQNPARNLHEHAHGASHQPLGPARSKMAKAH